MIIDSPIFSGSYAATGSLNQIGNVTITGSLTVTGTINASITGSITTASYALSAELLDGLDSTSFVFTSSFNTVSSSFSTRVTNLENFSSSLDATFATDAQLTALSQSFSSSLSTVSGSLSFRVTNNEATGSNLTTASGSFSTRTTNLELASGSFSTRVTNLETASGSFSTRVTTAENNITNLQNASSSFSTRVTSAENSIVSIQGATSSYATTGSNNFVGTQYISATNNAVGFTTTASLYTDGGIRIAKDMYVSGNAYFNNVTIYGTQSVNYITSSQLNIGTNIINVNTNTPTIRFGGLAVYDSGSTGLTGSILWDSEDNQWIYSNPSGSTYDSAVFLVGPRNSGVLGNEPGISCNFLSKGNGLHHMTSSGIFEDGSRTCFYGNTVIGSGGTVCSTMGNFTCMGVGSPAPAYPLDICGTARSTTNFVVNNGTVVGNFAIETAQVQIGTSLNHPFVIYTCNNERIRVTNTGIACFSCQVCAPAFVGGTISGTTIYGSTIVCSPQSNFTYTGNTGNVVRINGDNLTTGTALSIVLNNGSPSHTGNVVEICNAFNAGATAKLMCLYQGDDGDGIYINMARGGVGLTVDGVGGGYSAIFNNGNVGIGTSSPSEQLHLYNTGTNPRPALFIETCNTAATPEVRLFQTSGRSILMNLQTNGDWSFQNSANNSSYNTRLTIASTGIACFACQICAPQFIGTSSTLSNNITISKAKSGTGVESDDLITLRYTGTGAIGDNTNISWRSTDGSYTIAKIGGISGADNIAYGSLAFTTRNYFTDSLVEVMRITNRGNVGIGTTSPAEKLEISGTSNIYAKVTSTSTGANAGIRFNSTGSREYGIFTDGDLRFYDFTAASERMRITSGGQILLNTTSTRSTGYQTSQAGQIAAEFTNYGGAQWFTNVANDEGSYLILGKSRGVGINCNTVVQSGDTLGALIFQGTDGSTTWTGAQIRVKVDGSPGANDMPGRLEFYTTADGGTTQYERFRIAASGVACFACELTAKSLGTNDLILNNLNYECANYVDGTRGSWLIQEGACDLFIINQVSCKKYKFNLIEIK